MDTPFAIPSASPREIELKLFVPQASAAELWSHPLIVAHAVGPLKVARLANRYFDTARRELATAGMALRLRRSGRRWVQTLKIAMPDQGALSERGEWEMPVAGPALELAGLAGTPLAEVGSARTLAKRLMPLFTTDFRRESRLLRLPDGSEIEFAFDRGSIVAGRGRSRRTAPICEVEIELKQAGSKDVRRQLLRFATRYAEEVALIPLAASKAERGYRLVDGIEAGASKVVLPRPGGTDRVLPHLGRVLAACNDALLANVHALLARGPLPEFGEAVECVHQARVAIRRMRSALFTFRPVAKGRRFDAIDDALRAIGHAFGDVRDGDVLASSTFKHFDDSIGRDREGASALTELRSTIAQRRTAALVTLMGLFETGAFGATTISIQRLAARLGADEAAGPRLDACVPRWLARQCDRVTVRARRIAVLDLVERHALRIEVKRLRYALDLFGPLFDEPAVETFHDALADLQTRLGKLTDQAVAGQLLRSMDPAPARDLVLTRYDAWFVRHVGKQLPKVGAQSIALELTPKPWTIERPAAFG